jgi:hypothetical protein
MDEKNIIMKDNLIIWTTRFVLNAIVTTLYTTPVYMVLFLIIFHEYSLLSEISIRCYLLVYFMAYWFFFVVTYLGMEKNKNK